MLLLAYADGALGLARAPAVLAGARLGFGVRQGAFSGAAEAHFETTPAPAHITPIDRVDVTTLSGALVPCGHFDRVQICGVVTLGSVQAKALDVSRPEIQSSLFAVVGLRAGMDWPLARVFALRAHGSFGLTLSRAAYVIGGKTAFTTAPIEASESVGAEVRFR